MPGIAIKANWENADPEVFIKTMLFQLLRRRALRPEAAASCIGEVTHDDWA
jgi:hypothetical protein